MGSESIAHGGERNNCFSRSNQLVKNKQLQLAKRDSAIIFFGFQTWRFSLLVGYNIQPSSNSTNQNVALIIDSRGPASETLPPPRPSSSEGIFFFNFADIQHQVDFTKVMYTTVRQKKMRWTEGPVEHPSFSYTFQNKNVEFLSKALQQGLNVLIQYFGDFEVFVAFLVI